MFGECLIHSGKTFQIRGPVTAKAQSPDLQRVLGSPLILPTSIFDICSLVVKIIWHTDEAGKCLAEFA